MTKKTCIYVITMLSVLSLCGGKGETAKRHGVQRKLTVVTTDSKRRPSRHQLVLINKGSRRSSRIDSPAPMSTGSNSSSSSPLNAPSTPSGSPSLIRPTLLTDMKIDRELNPEQREALMLFLNGEAYCDLPEDSLD